MSAPLASRIGRPSLAKAGGADAGAAAAAGTEALDRRAAEAAPRGAADASRIRGVALQRAAARTGAVARPAERGAPAVARRRLRAGVVGTEAGAGGGRRLHVRDRDSAEAGAHIDSALAVRAPAWAGHRRRAPAGVLGGRIAISRVERAREGHDARMARRAGGAREQREGQLGELQSSHARSLARGRAMPSLGRHLRSPQRSADARFAKPGARRIDCVAVSCCPAALPWLRSCCCLLA